MEGDVLIKDAILVNPTLPPKVIHQGWLLMEDSVIKAVGSGDPPKDIRPRKKTLSANGNILMPGLVNLHTHSAMSLFRGLADDLPLKEWLEGYIFPAEAKVVNEEFVYWGALLSCCEMILSGTTTFADGYFHEIMVLEAARLCGIRATVAQGIVDFPAPGCPDPSLNIECAIAFLNHAKEEEPVRGGIFCHSAYTCSPETIRKAKEVSRVHEVLFFIHVAETSWEVQEIKNRYGVSPVEHLERIGVLDEATVLVHGVWLDTKEIEIIARSGAGVVTCTESNMKLAAGLAPLPQLLKRGVRVGIGTDGPASNNDLDLFGEMDLTAKVHKVASSDPTVVDASQVLHMATRGGANILGLKDVGLLEPGFQADLILIDTEKPHMQPLYHPISQLVYAAKGSDVKSVWVKGRQIMEDRRILTVDVEEVMLNAARLAKEIPTKHSSLSPA